MILASLLVFSDISPIQKSLLTQSLIPPLHTSKNSEKDFLITVERSPSNKEGLEQLLQRNLIDAVTIPDLSFSEVVIALKRNSLREKIKRRSIRDILKSRLEYEALDYVSETPEAILTVATHNRTEQQIRERIQKGVDSGAKGLLILSGGGPKKRIFQKIPWVKASLLKHPWLDRVLQKIGPINKFLPTVDSFRGIQIAREMLGHDFSILAVENPNIDLVGRAEQKIEEGADGIILHPMFRKMGYRLWWEQAYRRGLTKRAKISVTIPIINSAASLQMWFALTGINSIWRYWLGLDPRDPEAKELLQQFREVEGRKKDEREEFYKQWAIQMIQEVRQLPEIAGIHLISLDAVSVQLIEEILEESDSITPDHNREYLKKYITDLENLGVLAIYEPGLLDGRYTDELAAGLKALKEVLEEASLDERPRQFRTYWNRISNYQHHFRAPVAIRSFVEKDKDGKVTDTGEWEIAVDLYQLLWEIRETVIEKEGKRVKKRVRRKRSKDQIKALLSQSLLRANNHVPESIDGIIIGTYRPHSQTVIYDLNRSFWTQVGSIEEALGLKFDDSIGKSPDANPQKVSDNVRRYLESIKSKRTDSAKTGTRKKKVYLDVGAGSPGYAKMFLTELIGRASNQGDLPFLMSRKYICGDYSSEVLEKARAELGDRQLLNPEGAGVLRKMAIEMGYVSLNARHPHTGLQMIEDQGGEIDWIHLTNVLDNLETNKFAQFVNPVTKIRRYYLIEARLYLPMTELDKLAENSQYEKAIDKGQLQRDLIMLGREEITVEHFLSSYRSRFQTAYNREEERKNFYHFWFDLWYGLRLEERYVLIPDVSKFNLVNVHGIDQPGKILEEVLAEYDSDVWIHLSNGVIEGVMEFLDHLAPDGVLEISDVFVREIQDYHGKDKPRMIKDGKLLYRAGYPGDAKYDGALFNPVNLRLLWAFIERRYPQATLNPIPLADYGKPHMYTIEIRPNKQPPSSSESLHQPAQLEALLQAL